MYPIHISLLVDEATAAALREVTRETQVVLPFHALVARQAVSRLHILLIKSSYNFISMLIRAG
jgi:hypothetical protein